MNGKSVMYLESRLDELGTLVRAEFEASFPMSRREGAITWDKCTLPEIVELSKFVLVSVSIGLSDIVEITAYLNNIRFGCRSTIAELTASGVEVR